MYRLRTIITHQRWIPPGERNDAGGAIYVREHQEYDHLPEKQIDT